jgi:hypothetical protein
MPHVSRGCGHYCATNRPREPTCLTAHTYSMHTACSTLACPLTLEYVRCALQQRWHFMHLRGSWTQSPPKLYAHRRPRQAMLPTLADKPQSVARVCRREHAGSATFSPLWPAMHNLHHPSGGLASPPKHHQSGVPIGGYSHEQSLCIRGGAKLPAHKPQTKILDWCQPRHKALAM